MAHEEMQAAAPARKVGVFGGTFDPVHNGHLAIADAVMNAKGLDAVLFAVTSDQWLRSDPPVASSGDRFRMVEIAVDNCRGFEASDVDIAREGSTYTVDTLTDLRGRFGEATELTLIVGADAALSMDRWRSADQIVSLANIVAVGRPGTELDVASLDDSHPAKGAEYVEGPMVDVSATAVRDRLRAGESVDGLVAGLVAEYIEANGLYR